MLGPSHECGSLTGLIFQGLVDLRRRAVEQRARGVLTVGMTIGAGARLRTKLGERRRY
jgi:hypothetical protein